MAIVFVASGTPVGGNTDSGGTLVNVPTPAGLAANQLLVMSVLTDDNRGPFTPSGWKRLGYVQAGFSTSAPYYASPRLTILYKIATGSEGASVGVVFSPLAFPEGHPYYVASIVSYSGTDLTSPLGEWGGNSTTSTASAFAHPIVTTSIANDWLLTIRAGSGNTGAATYTIFGGTNAERIDTTDNQTELSLSIYDSNGALASGAQTQRTTTASQLLAYGSAGWSIAIRPPTSSQGLANPDEANAIGTAYNATGVVANGPWDMCAAKPAYTFAIDWDNDGDYTDPGEDVTTDILSGGVTVSYGRDQFRQLSPAKNGTASFALNNADRTYSPENTASPLYGTLDPARNMRGQVVFLGNTYALGAMRVDDYNVHADMDNRTVDFTFQDGMRSLDGPNLSTSVLSSQRTGYLINYILDQVGWTAGRSIDPGATVVPWWWAEGINALNSIKDLVKSEGPPAIAYVDLDGTFVFRDRHHRILSSPSLQSQANFNQNQIDPCTPPATAGLSFTGPFDYAHGWRDIVNSVQFSTSIRQPDIGLSSVWTYGSSFSLAIGQSMVLTASGSDPFINAVAPVAGTDYTLSGAGTVSVTLSRDNGQAVVVTVLAIGGSVTVSGLQLRARPISVVGTQDVSREDPVSISSHGEQAYPDTAPWASAEDAYAIAGTILLYYAQRRPTVQLRIVARDPEHLRQILERNISDRIHIVYGEMLIDDDFFIESVTHQIDRLNNTNGQAPIHSVVFGCEMALDGNNTNPFRFDVRGAGFDQGVFDPLVGDNPNTVFVFDDVRGSFDIGVFGT